MPHLDIVIRPPLQLGCNHAPLIPNLLVHTVNNLILLFGPYALLSLLDMVLKVSFTALFGRTGGEVSGYFDPGCHDWFIAGWD